MTNWRDSRNPEGGGSEHYVEQMARGLVASGHQVTLATARYRGAARTETVDGIRIVRAGSKLGVYALTALNIALGRYGDVDVVVDVQNGLPFFTRLATLAPVVVLVHHVHREQWPVVYPGLVGRIGWWIESRLAPRLYRRSRYITVSSASRLELIDLGVAADRIAIVHNGTDAAPGVTARRSSSVRLSVLSRLVPHKQIEHAIDALAAVRIHHHDATLDVIGSGWWDDELREYAAGLGLGDAVRFHGFVDERRKHELLAQAWVMLMPSMKEGWGLVIGEAGSHGVATIAYRQAGGPTESIDDKDSGLLVDDHDEFVRATVDLVADTQRCVFLGEGARAKSEQYSWSQSRRAFCRILEEAAGA